MSESSRRSSDELIGIWRARAAEHHKRADRLGATIAGHLEAAEATTIEQCIAELLTAGEHCSTKTENGV